MSKSSCEKKKKKTTHVCVTGLWDTGGEEVRGNMEWRILGKKESLWARAGNAVYNKTLNSHEPHIKA